MLYLLHVTNVSPHIVCRFFLHQCAMEFTNLYRMALIFRGSLISRISRIFNRLRNYLNENVTYPAHTLSLRGVVWHEPIITRMCNKCTLSPSGWVRGYMMALLQYFKKLNVDKSYPGNLPDPQGELSKEVPSSSISAANAEVAAVQSSAVGAKAGCRGMYLKMSAKKKA